MSAGDFTQSLQVGKNAGQASIFNPRLGRFVQADIIVPFAPLPQTLNRYSYTANNPINYVDPDGHCAPICTVLGLGAIGGIVGGILYLVNENVNGDGFDHSEDLEDLAVAFTLGAVAGGLIGVGQLGLAGAVASPLILSTGFSMGAALIIDHTENLRVGEDFSATGHTVNGAVGAILGPLGPLYSQTYTPFGSAAMFMITAGTLGFVRAELECFEMRISASCSSLDRVREDIKDEGVGMVIDEVAGEFGAPSGSAGFAVAATRAAGALIAENVGNGNSVAPTGGGISTATRPASGGGIIRGALTTRLLFL